MPKRDRDYDVFCVMCGIESLRTIRSVRTEEEAKEDYLETHTCVNGQRRNNKYELKVHESIPK